MVLKVSTQQVGLESSIESVVNRINRRGLKVKINSNDFTQPLGRITQKADEFTKSLEASNARVIAFGASAAIIGTVAKGFEQLVVQAVKFEKLLTDINVVLGTSSTNLAKFGDNLFKVARNTSQALDVAAEAALEFSRQGLSMEETLRRTNDALILTRLTGIKAADAVSGLTAAVNGFADAGLTTTSIINKLAAVDVKFAVSADDLINALARAGAVAQDAGVNFDQLVGAVTSAQQITARGGAVIGNSFKTIFTRIQRSSTLDRLQELGIAVRDIRGATLPALTVLTNLSKTYDTLGSSTKAAVAEQVGGVFQINVLKAALKDLNRENSLYAQATQISNNATDQAQQKNAQLQKTLSSLATQTSLSIQELSANIGELALAPGIKNLLDAINNLGTGLNDLLGKNAEGVGADFGKAIVRGIGGVISGPGMVLAFGIFAKLFANALKFAKSSLKDILGIVSQKDKERQIQESIVMAMNNNKTLAEELNRMSGNKLKQEELILAVIKQQTASIQAQQNIAKGVAPGLARKGVNPDLTMNTKGRGGASSGFVPNFSSSVTPFERQKERGSAIKAGYTPGNVSDINIKGVGRVVYNTAETVKKFPGMQQPAIMPPQGSDAGQKYKYKFAEKHGFNPYSFNGFVPNFADPRTRGQKIRDTLNDPANKGIKFKNLASGKNMDFKLKSASDRRFVEIFLKQKTGDGALYLDRLKKVSGYSDSQINNLRQLKKSYQSGSPISLSGKEVLPSGFVPNFALAASSLGNVLRLPKAKMFVQTSDNKYAKGGWHNIKSQVSQLQKDKGAKQLSSQLMALEALGISTLTRPFYFTKAGDPLNKVAKSARRKQKGLSGGNKSRIPGSVYEKGLEANLSKKGYISTSKDPSANVDFLAPGRTPIEAKFNSAKANSIMAKSLKLTTDRYLENYLSSKGMTPFATSLSDIKRDLALKSAGKIWGGGGNTEVSGFNLSSGFVPNFSNPLAEAVRREREAGLSDPKIRIDQDSRLKSKDNPLGLAVTNTRDEPLGVQQGIERARAMGIDPKTHGASSGLIPNFAKLKPASDELRDKFKLKKQNKGVEDASGGLMMGMFALTSMTYALEAAIGEAESGFAQFSKVTNSAIMGVSQSAMIYSGLNQIGQQQIDKGTKMSTVFGRVAKGAGILGAVVGTAIPVFQALKENYTIFDSGLDTLRKSAEKTSKGIDALGTAISSAEGVESTRKELAELNTGAMAGTYQGEMQRLKLNAQLIKQQSELAAQSGKLGKQLNLTESEIKAMTDGTASGMKKLQEAMLQAQQQMAVTSSMQSFVSAQGGSGLFAEDPDPLSASLQKTNIAQMTAGALNGDSAALDKAMASIESLMNKVNPETGMSPLSIDAGFVRRANDRGVENPQLSLPKEIKDQFEKDVADSDLPHILKSQISAALKGRVTLTKLAEFFEEQKGLAGQFTKDLKQQTKESEGSLEISRQIKKARQETLNSMELGKIDYSIEQNLAKLNQSHMMQEMSYRAKLNDSLGILSNSASIDLELKNREQQIQNDYINQKSAINRETVEAQQKLIKDLFAGGGSFKPEEMFAGLSKDFKEKDTITTIASSSTDSGINNENPMGPTNNQRALTRTIKGETFEGGTKEAFEGNLKETIKKLEKSSLKELAAQLEKTKITEDLVANQDHANQITLEYLSNLDKTKQIEAIRALQGQGIISKTADIESVIQKILDAEKKKLDGALEEETRKKKNLALVTKELSLGKQTVAAAQARFRAYSELAISEKGLKGSIQEQLQEVLDFNIMQSSMNKNIGENTRSILMSEEHRSQLALSMQSLMEGELTKEVQSLVNQEARLKAEQELRKNTELYSQIMAIKAKTEVGKSIMGMQDSSKLDSKTLEEEKKQKKFAIEAETNLTKAKNAAEREQLAFNEKLKAGGFQLDALNEMAAASRDFTASMIKAREKLAAGESFNEGVRSVEQGQMSAAQGLQKAQGKVSATEGNSITNSRAMVELTEAQRELNIQQNAGTLFADSMAVKMAEANKELAMFGKTLAETSFDAMSDGFRGLFDDLIDGSKSAGDATLNFFAGIAKKIQDKLLDRASTQLAVGFSDMLGLDDVGRNNSGGLIQGYAKGGTVGGGKVPSMLTAGEYVVKKKIVDRLGSSNLDSINKTGSLDELYNKPNEDIFDITTEGAATIPPIMRFQDGGNVASYLTQRNMGYDRVSENERSTVNGEVVNDFTNALDSVFQKHNKQNVAGKHEKSYNSTYNNSDTSNSIQHYRYGGGVDKAVKGGSGKSSLQNIAEGAGYMAGSYLGTSQDPGEPPKAPEAPKNQRLNTRSRLNLDAAGADRAKMSQSFIANDSYTKEMKKYHLDMYEFSVQQKNEAEKERAGKIASIAGTAAIAGGMALGKGAQKMYGDYKHNQNMKHIDNAYTQMNIDNGTASSMFEKSIGDANKTLSLDYHTDVSSLKNNTIYGDNTLSADTRNFVNTPFSSTKQYNSSSSIAGGNYSSSSAFSKNYNSSSMSNSSKNSFASTEMENYLSSYDQSNKYSNTSSFSFGGKFNKGGVVNNKTIKPYSYYNKGGAVNVSNNPYSYFNKGGSVNNVSSNPYSYFNRGGSVNNTSSNSTNNAYSNPYSYFNRGGNVSVSNNPYSYLNQGGSVYSNHSNPYSYFNSGGSVNNVSNSNIQKFSGGGKVNGPGGIDKVGPVLLDKGEYVIKASSVNKVEKKYPGFFDKLNSSKMKDGGKVGAESAINNTTSNIENSKSSDNNSVVVNINISSNGSTSVDGGSDGQQAFASKIKDAVTGIISQEKRVGGMLRGK